jgi:hypothetical protein
MRSWPELWSRSDDTSTSTVRGCGTWLTWPRRTFEACGEKVRLVPTWCGAFGTSTAGEVRLPGGGDRLGHITFDNWLVHGAV